jgi:hypothetical protein
MEQLVTHFPSLAAWLIVIIGAALLGLVGFGGREMIKRLDSQDTALDQIRQLLASEVHKLREMQHCIDIRLARVEERMHNGGDVKYGRRADDHLGDR